MDHSKELPVLPVRDIVVLPSVVTTLNVIRPSSRAAIESALGTDKALVVIAQRDANAEEVSDASLFTAGTISHILQWTPMANGTSRIVLRGVAACEVEEFLDAKGVLSARVREVGHGSRTCAETKALAEELRHSFQSLEAVKALPAETIAAALALEDVASLVYTVTHFAIADPSKKQRILGEPSLTKRLRLLVGWLREEELISEQRLRIRKEIDSRITESNRTYRLREELRAIQAELGDLPDDADKYRSRLEAATLPPEVTELCGRQIEALRSQPPDGAEAAAIAKHVESLLRLPVEMTPERDLPMREARRALSKGHFGLEGAKSRILEYIAVKKLVPDYAFPPLCFVGPPGVGKTSFARTVAEVLGRPYGTISLGGVHDEAEIRGHRRSYVGAQPGRVVEALLRSGASNPVLLLDEIDKCGGQSGYSDPASAMLELLDPEQNRTFLDHFLDVPIDLSSVLFIATANSLDPLPRALVDRLEVIEFPSYTRMERTQIAWNYLLPAALDQHGLSNKLKVTEVTAKKLVDGVCEPGVRALQRTIATLCRRVAAFMAESEISELVLDPENLTAFVEGAIELHHGLTSGAGVANCLVVSREGGDVVQIESACLERDGAPALTLTGAMGETMRETASTAYSCLRSLPAAKPLLGRAMHIHASQAGRTKDGPSAGLPIFLSLYSLATDRSLPLNLAATGEISLRGLVSAVGGIREKLSAAERMGVTTVMIPEANLPELAKLPKDLLSSLKIVPVSTVQQAIAALEGVAHEVA